MSQCLRDLKLEIEKRFYYEPDTGGVFYKLPTRRRASGDLAGTIGSHGYLTIRIKDKVYRLHRIIFLLMGHDVPEVVDHINGDKTDNRWINLRGCTQSQNLMNRRARKGSTSGVKNVYWSKEKELWQVNLTVSGKYIHCGYYSDFKEAERSAKEARVKYHGEFLRHE